MLRKSIAAPVKLVASDVWVLFQIGWGMKKRRKCGYVIILPAIENIYSNNGSVHNLSV